MKFKNNLFRPYQETVQDRVDKELQGGIKAIKKLLML